jgi:membrane-bound ClpP family serine protease
MADIYGRNADVAESFVRDATSISATQALEDGVIDLIEPNVDSLLATVSGTTVTLGDGSTATLPDLTNLELQERSMSPGANFFHAILDPNLAFIFFWLGLLLIVIEIIVPGHIFAGTIGTILLLTSFVAFGLLPVRIIGVVLLVISVIAFIVELRARSRDLGCRGADRARARRMVPVRPRRRRRCPLRARRGRRDRRSVLRGGRRGGARLRHAPSLLAGKTIVGQDGVALRRRGAGGGIVRVASEEWRAVRRPARSRRC